MLDFRELFITIVYSHVCISHMIFLYLLLEKQTLFFARVLNIATKSICPNLLVTSLYKRVSFSIACIQVPSLYMAITKQTLQI